MARVLAALLLLVGSSLAVFDFYGKHRTLPSLCGDCGSPLYLTPYLKDGNISGGQTAAEVKDLMTSVKSYSGLFTVNETYNSNMFFWYFRAEKNWDSAPLVIWLQGGPGASSMTGLFTENGPFYIGKKGKLNKRGKGRWNEDFNLLYFDSPVGTGFSWTGSEAGYAKTEEDVGRDLLSATTQFLELFPNLTSSELFVTGESYAGKYVPALARALRGSLNLRGIAMGNGYSAPDLMIDYGEYLYQIGLVDSNGRELFERKQEAVLRSIKAEDWPVAFDLLWDLVVGGGLFENLTTYTYHYNLLHNRDASPFGDMDAYLQQDSVRKSIHVGNLTFHSGKKVQYYLSEDFPQSVKPWIEELLESTRVLVYSGQLDIIVAYPLTENFLKHLDWSGAVEYKTATRSHWYVGGDLAGYAKTAGNLTEVLVRDAGHMVPMDQPVWALDMIKRFIYRQPFN